MTLLSLRVRECPYFQLSDTWSSFEVSGEPAIGLLEFYASEQGAAAGEVLIFLQWFQDAVFANSEQRACFMFSKNVRSSKNAKGRLNFAAK